MADAQLNAITPPGGESRTCAGAGDARHDGKDAAAGSGITFTVEPGIKPERYTRSRRNYREPAPSSTIDEAWAKTASDGGSVEAMSAPPAGEVVEVFTTQNLLAKAVHAAFFGHHPLVLSPDVIWLTIAQGLANHVDQNAEALRSKFVSHDGKKELVIERPDFVKGSPHNDWPGVFPEFAAQIAANTANGVAELVTSDFSTTGPIERIASQITLMDTVQHYFSYTMSCGCGFPEITLSGTPADWEQVRAKAEQLKAYDLDWWLEGLVPALDEFVAAAHGSPDLDFWRSLCMINVGTSFPVYEPLTGWIQAFFPYLNASGYSDWGSRFDEAEGGGATRKLMKNTDLASYLSSFKGRRNLANAKFDQQGGGMGFERAAAPAGIGRGIKLELIPPAMASAPFCYQDHGTNTAHEMAFFAGATCLVQHQSGAIEPVIGWAVIDSGRSALLRPG